MLKDTCILNLNKNYQSKLSKIKLKNLRNYKLMNINYFEDKIILNHNTQYVLFNCTECYQ